MSPQHSAPIIAVPLLLSLVVSLSGCHGLQRQIASEKSPGSKRLERKADVVKSFEARRDQAQHEAALERAASGDLAGSEQMLRSLVARQPGIADYRLQLAELLCLRGDFPAAEKELQAAVALAPERAEAHHAFGILLSTLERHDEARQHLSIAANLEPANELYSLALEAN